MKLDTVIAQRPNKTVYRDGDHCIKVFNEDYSKSDVLNEALNQARVEETGLNIPKIIEVTKIDGKWAIVTDFIEGKTLAQLMEENPEKTEEYIDLMVDLQLSVHQKKAPLLTKLKDKMNRKITLTDLDATTRTSCTPDLRECPSTTRSATVILTRRISSSPQTERPISLTGHTQRRAMPQQMPQEPIFCSALQALKKQRTIT
jgi:hypothetical protein